MLTSSILVGRCGLAAPILLEKIYRAEQVVKSKAAWMGQGIPSKNWDYKSQPQFLAYDLFRLLWVSLVFRDPSCLSWLANSAQHRNACRHELWQLGEGHDEGICAGLHFWAHGVAAEADDHVGIAFDLEVTCAIADEDH